MSLTAASSAMLLAWTDAPGNDLTTILRRIARAFLSDSKIRIRGDMGLLASTMIGHGSRSLQRDK